MIKIHR